MERRGNSAGGSQIKSSTAQKEKNKYHIVSLICGICENGTDELICKAEIETQM